MPALTRVLSAIAASTAAAFALSACTPASTAATSTNADGATKIVISEPVHSLGYLPLYVATVWMSPSPPNPPVGART
jgi:hypothetical protein